ncbi:MAG: ribosome recycling factor [bacterium]
MPEQINKAEQEFKKTIDFLQNEIASIRTGRAHPSLIDGIYAQAYGTKTPLNQLASISIPEAMVLVIAPWDKSIIGEIEKAIRESEIGINPVNEGGLIRLVIPKLTEETRKNLIKILNKKIEQAKISLRQIRDKIKDEIIDLEKNKDISQDEKFDLLKKLDDKIAEFNGKIKEVGDKKEKEIMTI